MLLKILLLKLKIRSILIRINLKNTWNQFSQRTQTKKRTTNKNLNKGKINQYKSNILKMKSLKNLKNQTKV